MYTGVAFVYTLLILLCPIGQKTQVSVEYPDWIKERCEETMAASIRKQQNQNKMRIKAYQTHKYIPLYAYYNQAYLEKYVRKRSLKCNVTEKKQKKYCDWKVYTVLRNLRIKR